MNLKRKNFNSKHKNFYLDQSQKNTPNMKILKHISNNFIYKKNNFKKLSLRKNLRDKKIQLLKGNKKGLGLEYIYLL